MVEARFRKSHVAWRWNVLLAERFVPKISHLTIDLIRPHYASHISFAGKSVHITNITLETASFVHII